MSIVVYTLLLNLFVSWFFLWPIITNAEDFGASETRAAETGKFSLQQPKCIVGSGQVSTTRETCNLFEISRIQTIQADLEARKIEADIRLTTLPDGRIRLCATPVGLDQQCHARREGTVVACHIDLDNKESCLPAVRRSQFRNSGAADRVASWARHASAETVAGSKVSSLISAIRSQHERGESGLPFTFVDKTGVVVPLDAWEQNAPELQERGTARFVQLPSYQYPSEQTLQRYLDGELTEGDVRINGTPINEIRARITQQVLDGGTVGLFASDAWSGDSEVRHPDALRRTSNEQGVSTVLMRLGDNTPAVTGFQKPAATPRDPTAPQPASVSPSSNWSQQVISRTYCGFRAAVAFVFRASQPTCN